MGALGLQGLYLQKPWVGMWVAGAASQAKTLGAALGAVETQWFCAAGGWAISPHDALQLGLGARAFLGRLEGQPRTGESAGRGVWELAAGPVVTARAQQALWGAWGLSVQAELGWTARGMEAREQGRSVWSLSGFWGMIGAGASFGF